MNLYENDCSDFDDFKNCEVCNTLEPFDDLINKTCENCIDDFNNMLSERRLA